MADIIVSSDVDTFMQSANQSAMRTNVGSGTIVTQNSNNVSITGGSITGITDLSVADGGTGSSTASGARANLEVYGDSEVDTKLATKAVAGGVELVNATLSISNGPVIGTSDFSIVFKVNFNTSVQSQGIFSSFVGGSEARGITVFTGSSPAGQLIFRLFGATSGDRIQAQVNNFINTYGGTDRTIAFVRSGSALQIIVDGVEISFVESTTGTSPTWGGSIDSNDWRLLAAAVSSNSATLRGSWFFNRALSAAEVADLYETGVVAVADRWGDGAEGDTYTSDFSVNADGFASGAGGNLTVTGNTDSVSAVDDTLKATAVANVNMYLTKSSGDQMEVGIAYKVEFDYYADSGCGIAYIGLGIKDARWDNGGVAVVEGSWQTGQTLFTDSAGSNLRTFAGFTTETGDTNDTLVSGTSIYFKNVKFTRLGAIADLPLDEGIGYQFHDRSSNHFDALASLTGVTHLVPKANGKVRVKAANASSAMYMLRADSILPENSIVSNVLSEQCYVDLTNSAQTLNDYRIRLNPSGSDLQIQRSDGSNHQTLGTVTAPSSLSDVDVQINYKQIAQ